MGVRKDYDKHDPWNSEIQSFGPPILQAAQVIWDGIVADGKHVHLIILENVGDASPYRLEVLRRNFRIPPHSKPLPHRRLDVMKIAS
jgi:hypothetical protein